MTAARTSGSATTVVDPARRGGGGEQAQRRAARWSTSPLSRPRFGAPLEAVQAKLERLAGISGGGADALADEYIDAVVRGTVEKLQHELVVFGRIDDDHTWRVGLYGIDRNGEQLVIDWRAPFAGKFYQARFDEPLELERRVTYVGSIVDLFIEDFASGEVSGTSPLLGELSRSRGSEMRTAVATLQSEQDELVRLDPTAKLVLRGGPGTGKTVVALHRAAWLVYNDTRLTAGRILVIGPSDKFLRFVAAVLPTLGEARITQTTFDRLLGPSCAAGSDERWLDGARPLRGRRSSNPDRSRSGLAADRRRRGGRAGRARGPAALPWRDKRRIFVELLAARHGLPRRGGRQGGAGRLAGLDHRAGPQAAAQPRLPRRARGRPRPRRGLAGRGRRRCARRRGPRPHRGRARHLRPRDRRRGPGPHPPPAAGRAAPVHGAEPRRRRRQRSQPHALGLREAAVRLAWTRSR